MTIEHLLRSLSDAERDFIAALDYGADRVKHRAALDTVIQNGGAVDFGAQGFWYPYEVIELGKNWLQEGHDDSRDRYPRRGKIRSPPKLLTLRWAADGRGVVGRRAETQNFLHRRLTVLGPTSSIPGGHNDWSSCEPVKIAR